MKKRKLIIVCGPTAVGKTKLSLLLAKVFSGEIVSADARQVYKYMDIGTGKDKTKDANIFGYDLIAPDTEFSVKKYVDFAHKAIEEIYKRRRLPILVGGTGLYIKAVVDNLANINIPRDLKLRESLHTKSAQEIFNQMMEKFPKKVGLLNNSEKNNKQRLIRIFEILTFDGKSDVGEVKKFDSILWVGLTASKEILDKKIGERVDGRIKAGFEKEVNYLKTNGFLQGAPSKTLGYQQWISYLEGEVGKEEAIENWKVGEAQYAKRQMVWFRKEKRINWFDTAVKNYENEIVKLVEKWYDQR